MKILSHAIASFLLSMDAIFLTMSDFFFAFQMVFLALSSLIMLLAGKLLSLKIRMSLCLLALATTLLGFVLMCSLMVQRIGGVGLLWVFGVIVLRIGSMGVLKGIIMLIKIALTLVLVWIHSACMLRLMMSHVSEFMLTLRSGVVPRMIVATSNLKISIPALFMGWLSICSTLMVNHSVVLKLLVPGSVVAGVCVKGSRANMVRKLLTLKELGDGDVISLLIHKFSDCDVVLGQEFGNRVIEKLSD